MLKKFSNCDVLWNRSLPIRVPLKLNSNYKFTKLKVFLNHLENCNTLFLKIVYYQHYWVSVMVLFLLTKTKNVLAGNRYRLLEDPWEELWDAHTCILCLLYLVCLTVGSSYVCFTNIWKIKYKSKKENSKLHRHTIQWTIYDQSFIKCLCICLKVLVIIYGCAA